MEAHLDRYLARRFALQEAFAGMLDADAGDVRIGRDAELAREAADEMRDGAVEPCGCISKRDLGGGVSVKERAESASTSRSYEPSPAGSAPARAIWPSRKVNTGQCAGERPL